MAAGAPDPTFIGLTNTQLNTDIDTYIKKAPPGTVLDPNKTQGAWLNAIMKNLVQYTFERTQNLPVTNPNGVSFETAPSTPTVSGTYISVGASSVNVAGTSKSVAAQTLTFAYTTTGTIRKDAIVVNYNATTAVYESITGTEVTNTATAVTPTIPSNKLFVCYVDVTDGGGFTIAPGGTSDPTKLDVAAGATTGTSLTFTTDRVYGTESSPATGNITVDTTGAKLLVSNLVIHNSGTAPTIGGYAIGTNTGVCKQIKDSPGYVPGVNNFIEFRYLSTSTIHYSIYQLKP